MVHCRARLPLSSGILPQGHNVCNKMEGVLRHVYVCPQMTQQVQLDDAVIPNVSQPQFLLYGLPDSCDGSE